MAIAKTMICEDMFQLISASSPLSFALSHFWMKNVSIITSSCPNWITSHQWSCPPLAVNLTHSISIPLQLTRSIILLANILKTRQQSDGSSRCDSQVACSTVTVKIVPMGPDWSPHVTISHRCVSRWSTPKEVQSAPTTPLSFNTLALSDSRRQEAATESRQLECQDEHYSFVA